MQEYPVQPIKKATRITAEEGKNSKSQEKRQLKE